MATKIITGKQAKAAVQTIQRKTGWTINRTASALGWPRETLSKIADGRTKTPSQDRMDAIAELLSEVEESV